MCEQDPDADDQSLIDVPGLFSSGSFPSNPTREGGFFKRCSASSRIGEIPFPHRLADASGYYFDSTYE